MLVVTISCLKFLGDVQECCSRKLLFECTMQVKCLDAVVDEKKPVILVEVLPCIASSTEKKPSQNTATTCKYRHVMVLSENSSWYRVVYQGTWHWLLFMECSGFTAPWVVVLQSERWSRLTWDHFPVPKRTVLYTIHLGLEHVFAWVGKHSDPIPPLNSRLKLVPESSKYHVCETSHLRKVHNIVMLQLNLCGGEQLLWLVAGTLQVPRRESVQ